MKLPEFHVYYGTTTRPDRLVAKTRDGREIDLTDLMVLGLVREVSMSGDLPKAVVEFGGYLIEHGPES